MLPSGKALTNFGCGKEMKAAAKVLHDDLAHLLYSASIGRRTKVTCRDVDEKAKRLMSANTILSLQGDDRGGQRGGRYDPYEDDRRASSRRRGAGGGRRGAGGMGGFDLTGTITKGNKSEFWTVWGTHVPRT